MSALSQLRNRIITSLLFLFLLAVLFVKIKTPFNFYDEGFALFGSTRVAQGDIPYKDFWAIYPPGQFYAVAGLFKIVGTHLLPTRIYDTLLRFILVIGVYLVMKKITARGPALLAALIAAFLLASAGFYSYAIFPAMNLGLWAIWCWLKYSESSQNRWRFLSGILLGIAALIRWDLGLYAGASIFVAGYLYSLSCTIPSIARKDVSFKTLAAPLRVLAWVFGPMAAIAILGYAAIAIRTGWENLYEQVFLFPTFQLHAVRWLPYPALLPGFPPSYDWLRFYMPILILAPAAIAYAYRFFKNLGRRDINIFGTLSLILYAALLFNQALSRYDYIHVIPASILTFMVCTALFYQALPRFQLSRAKFAIYLLLAIPAFIYFYPAYRELANTLDSFAPWGCYSHLGKADCVPVDPNEEEAVAYIQAHTGLQDPIFVGNQHHDRIFVNDIGFYYLVDRPSATRYHELYPGVATTQPIQNEIANAIEARKVKWIVLVKIWDSTEPNASALSSGFYFLDDYLLAHYEPVIAFGNYQIMQRLVN